MEILKRSQIIAVVEDENDISDLISLHLKKNAFTTVQYFTAGEFINSLPIKQPDLVLLDLMLPDLDGMEICKYLKANEAYKDIPVIILTAKQDETDKVVGLEIGADDYITKPFSPRELVARVKAVLRRSVVSDKTEAANDKIINIADELFIDQDKYSVRDSAGNEILLTSTEYKILVTLALQPEWVFSREKLIAAIWGEDRYVIDRTIDVHIKHLREKIGESGRFIKNVRGVGYKIDTKE